MMKKLAAWTLLLQVAIGTGVVSAGSPEIAVRPEGGDRVARALHYATVFLSREVPRWRSENKCYSCHNNGDAARALFVAAGRGVRVERSAIDGTLRWLSSPGKWKDNGGKGPFSDKQLAEIQFAFALSEAVRAGLVRDKSPLRQAAQMLAHRQQADGSWKVDAGAVIGSPATYGPTLATVVCRHVLDRADPKRFAASIRRAEGWLRRQRPKNVFDCAAALLFAAQDEASGDLRRHCLKIIRSGQAPGGGWGPYATSQPEAFDTALVLLALSRLPANRAVDQMIAAGRRHLGEVQLEDGSWPETTRPAGGESYAQRISTTGWAALALLATDAS